MGDFSFRAVFRNESWIFCAGLLSMPISFDTLVDIIPAALKPAARNGGRWLASYSLAEAVRFNHSCTIRPTLVLFNLLPIQLTAWCTIRSLSLRGGLLTASRVG